MMPDHVHLIFQLCDKRSLEQVFHSLFSYSANKINEVLNRSGKLWQDSLYDHAIRNEQSLFEHIEYMANNPVRKGFVERPEDWPFKKINT